MFSTKRLTPGLLLQGSSPGPLAHCLKTECFELSDIPDTPIHPVIQTDRKFNRMGPSMARVYNDRDDSEMESDETAEETPLAEI